MVGAVTVESLSRHNAKRRPKWRCIFFGHLLSKAIRIRVRDRDGTQLCDTQVCDRCGQIQIAGVVKRNLNRRERRL